MWVRLENAVQRECCTAQAAPQQQESIALQEPAGNQAQNDSSFSNAADELGAVRSDIVAALRRREDLQGELRGTEAKIGAAESELGQIQSEVSIFDGCDMEDISRCLLQQYCWHCIVDKDACA